MSPAIVTSASSGAVCQLITSGRLARKRWSSVSQRDHVEPSPYVGKIGRGRYGTGFAGSETNESAALGERSVGGENDSLRSACTYRRRAETFVLSGQLARFCQVFDPASN